MDSRVNDYISQEKKRQAETITLIPSENYASTAVLEALGSELTNKYSEGYPHKRYYEGNEITDELEGYVQELAKKAFKVIHANIQPYSGSPANAAAQMAVLRPGETLAGMSLAGGGHLTHGHPEITFSGKFFRSVQYGVDETGRIDYGAVEAMVKKEKPGLLIAGTTAYPWVLDWERFGAIAESVGAYLMADISHISGLVVAGSHPSPVPYAHVVTTTTHKTLRGPRGAMVMVTERGLAKDPELPAKIDKAVFPGLQGGPHNNVIAAIGVALEEAQTEEFRAYGKQVVENAAKLAQSVRDEGIRVLGTENHLMLLDFSEFGGGGQVAYALALAGIVSNKNSIPFDPKPPFYPSGLRLGTPAVTTLGMGATEMERIARWIGEVAKLCREYPLPQVKEERAPFMKEFRQSMKDNRMLKMIREEVRELRKRFPGQL